MSDLHDDWRRHCYADVAAYRAERARVQAALTAWLDRRDRCHVAGWVESLTTYDRMLLAGEFGYSGAGSDLRIAAR